MFSVREEDTETVWTTTGAGQTPECLLLSLSPPETYDSSLEVEERHSGKHRVSYTVEEEDKADGGRVCSRVTPPLPPPAPPSPPRHRASPPQSAAPLLPAVASS